MKLTVLGSGTGISGPEKATSGFALQLPNETIVIDLGFGCFKNMQKAGIDYTKVNKIFFTHFEHLDHVNDLPALLFARHVAVRPIQLEIFGGPGFKKFIENLFVAFPFFKGLGFKLKVSELKSFATKKLQNFTLTTKPMVHEPSSIAFRIEANGKSVVFAGDTAPNEKLVELSRGADLLIAECSFAEKETSNHLNASQFANAASRAMVKKAMITHIYPEDEDKDFKALVAKGFKGEIILAKDLLQVEV